MKIEVSVITVGYKSEKTIGPFLDSLKKSTNGIKLEVIVINNYPDDRTVHIAAAHQLKPKVIKNNENIGFSKAINQGLKLAQGEYLLIMNPDTHLIGGALEKLLKFAKSQNSIGAVVPRLLNSDGSIQASCYRFPNITNAIKQNFFGVKNAYKKYNPGNSVTVVEVAVMAAMLIPKSTIDLVGGLDERFFLYYEDIEFCRRLKKHNLPIFYLPSAKIKHAHGASGNYTSHLHSPLLKSAKIYYGEHYFFFLNLVLWVGHKWQVILRGKKFKD